MIRGMLETTCVKSASHKESYRNTFLFFRVQHDKKNSLAEELVRKQRIVNKSRLCQTRNLATSTMAGEIVSVNVMGFVSFIAMVELS